MADDGKLRSAIRDAVKGAVPPKRLKEDDESHPDKGLGTPRPWVG